MNCGSAHFFYIYSRIVLLSLLRDSNYFSVALICTSLKTENVENTHIHTYTRPLTNYARIPEPN